jgi:hypothetical protein
MPGGLSRSINPNKTLTDRDKFLFLRFNIFCSLKNSLADCYLNPSKSVQIINNINYVQIAAIKPRVFEIPAIDCGKEQRLPNYKDVAHQQTEALRDFTEQQT